MTVTIGRRGLLAALGGAAAVWPLTAYAQQAERVRRIGLLMGVADDREGQARVTALKQGLQELGWTDGRNIQIEIRFAGADALYVAGDPLINANRVRINILAVGARLPTIYIQRESVEAGGLMSYGPNFPDLFRRAAEYVDKILRGAKPADIPVEQPTKFDLVVNLVTAKVLGLTVPPTLLARADEVIE